MFTIDLKFLSSTWIQDKVEEGKKRLFRGLYICLEKLKGKMEDALLLTPIILIFSSFSQTEGGEGVLMN